MEPKACVVFSHTGKPESKAGMLREVIKRAAKVCSKCRDCFVVSWALAVVGAVVDPN